MRAFIGVCRPRLTSVRALTWKLSRQSRFPVFRYSYSYRVTLFNELFSEESCSVIGLSEKMGLQLWSELSATVERWPEVRWKCVPDDRSRDAETSLADGRGRCYTHTIIAIFLLAVVIFSSLMHACFHYFCLNFIDELLKFLYFSLLLLFLKNFHESQMTYLTI